MTTTVGIGSERHLPPEIIANQPYNGQFADIFCLGLVLFQMLSGKMPFEEAKENDDFYKYFAKQRSNLYFKRFFPNFSDPLRNLFIDMF